MGRFAVLLVWVFALLVSLPTSARAANVEWLYDVDVVVADQSADLRATAARQALLTVLKRLSGLSVVPTNPAVTLALESPQRYYVEYRYREEPDPTRGAASTAKGLTLALRFAQPAMQRLIADANLPLWSSNRPTTVAWIVVADGANRTVLGASDTHPLLVGLRSRSRERGLPLVVPLMDLDEQLEVTDAVVWGALSGVLETASERYSADQILIGRISRGAADNWVGEWQLWTRGDKQRFTLEASSAAAQGSAIVDRLIDPLVARYVVDSGARQRLQVRVDGIAGVAEYGALLKYLGSLEFIDSVGVDEVRPGVVLLSLATRSPWDRLRDLLSLDGRFTSAEQLDTDTRHVLTWRGTTRK